MMSLPLRYELDIKCFTKLSQYIDSNLGIKMPETKKIMLESRLQKRLKALELGSFDDYCNILLSANGKNEESVEFFNAVTTNKTDFYREIAHFHYLTKDVLPDLVSKGHKNLNIWSCACSSGEEPYTLAFELDQFKKSHSTVGCSILATDISTRVLKRAKEGVYPKEHVEVIPQNILSSYFSQEQGVRDIEFRVKPSVKQMIKFARFNLMNKSYPDNGKYHIIFCRNVLIYFNRERQEMIIKNLLTQLHPDGYLFLGHSESMAGMNLNLKAVHSAVYQKEAGK